MALRIASALLLAALVWAAAAAAGGNCANTSTGVTPLNDLGGALYQGAQGGLYPGGSNQRPAGHNAAGVSIAGSIVPLDTLGVLDPAHGRIVFISIGMSNAVIEFNAFVLLAAADPLRNPHVRVINCAQGGQSADRIRLASSPYWDFVASTLRSAGSSPLQPQVVWIKEANANPTGGFPASADSLTANLGDVVRIIKQKLPNVKLCYITSRIYAGYATTTLNPEPYAYQSGFAVKALVSAQIAGVDSLNYDPARGTVAAPWLAWGPYLWADGLNPRSDGLTWPCSDFQSDGTHPDAAGAAVVADSLLAFFQRDETTAPWYLAPVASVPAHDASVALAVVPNPARGPFEVRFSLPDGQAWTLDLMDVAGRRVTQLGSGEGTGGQQAVVGNARGSGRAGFEAGVYWLRFTTGGRETSRRIVLVAR